MGISHNLTVVGASIPTGATGTMNIKPTIGDDDNGDPEPISLRDVATNPVKEEIAFPIKDEQSPTVVSKKITGPNEITIEFSEPVRAKLSNFGEFCVGAVGVCDDAAATDPSDDDVDRKLSSLSGNGTNMISFRISGEAIPTNSEGTLKFIIVDGAFSNYAIAGVLDLAIPPNTLTPDTVQLVEPGQTPKIVSAKIVDPQTVEIKFSEQIKTQNTNAYNVYEHVTFYKDRDSRPTTHTLSLIHI